MKWCVAFRQMRRKLIFRFKLLEMDEWWHFTGADSWGVFPPSFYYLHTKEEIARITAETFKILHDIVNDSGTGKKKMEERTCADMAVHTE